MQFVPGQRKRLLQVPRKTRVDTIIPGIPSDGLLIGIGSIFADLKWHDSRSGRERSCKKSLFSVLTTAAPLVFSTSSFSEANAGLPMNIGQVE